MTGRRNNLLTLAGIKEKTTTQPACTCACPDTQLVQALWPGPLCSRVRSHRRDLRILARINRCTHAASSWMKRLFWRPSASTPSICRRVGQGVLVSNLPTSRNACGVRPANCKVAGRRLAIVEPFFLQEAQSVHRPDHIPVKLRQLLRQDLRDQRPKP